MLQSLVEFPPSQKPASVTIEQVMAKLEAGITSASSVARRSGPG
jgi:hypothetical protein